MLFKKGSIFGYVKGQENPTLDISRILISRLQVSGVRKWKYQGIRGPIKFAEFAQIVFGDYFLPKLVFFSLNHSIRLPRSKPT